MEDELFLIGLNRMLMDAGVDALTDEQRMFLAVDILNTAALNNGLEHFFYYDGNLYESAVRGLDLIGLPSIAGRLKTYAESVFGTAYPVDPAKRQQILDDNGAGSDAAAAAFGKYLDIEPLVTAALIRWANENRKRLPDF